MWKISHTHIKYIENKRIITYNGGGAVPPSSKYETHNLDRANFHSTSARSYPQINVKNERKKEKTQKQEHECKFSTHQNIAHKNDTQQNDSPFCVIKTKRHTER